MDITTEINNCTKCNLHKSTIKRVISKQKGTPKVLFIGEAGGRLENETGVPFIGDSGHLLHKWINEINLTDYAMVNVCKCHPPNNRDPTEKEIQTCLPFLVEQIKTYDCEYIVTLGKIPFKTILPLQFDGTILKHVGKIYESMIAGKLRKVIVFPHPSYCLRSGYKPPLAILKMETTLTEGD